MCLNDIQLAFALCVEPVLFLETFSVCSRNWWFKTNHSLQVTSATRLFQGWVDEQLIMGRTGHRSIDGIRTYKRVSNEQKEDISHVLNSATNGDNI